MKLTFRAPFLFSILICWSLFVGFPRPTLAAEYQNCATGTSCTIGEYLFDDSYTPDATASCTLASRYPNGNAFLSPPVAMTASASGWYSYTAAIDSTEGIYPSQICCTTSTSEYLCLNKTFKVSATAPNAPSTADIWSYSGRSLTSFGTLIADIWGYSTRSLSNFGDLVSSIWTRDTRTFTNGETNTVTILATDVKEIKKVNKENRVLLEQLINKPIIKTFIDESPTPNLTEKLEKTKTAAANLYSGIQNLKSRSEGLSDKWDELTEVEIKDELNTLLSILKQDVNQKDTNILATTSWLKTSWNSPLLLNLSEQALATESRLNNLLNDLNLYGNITKAGSFNSTLTHIENLNDLVGTSLATSSDLNLFGFIKRTADRIALLDKQTAEGLEILTAIKKDKTKNQTTAIAGLSSKVLSANLVPQVDRFFQKSLKNTETPTNRVLGLLALVDTNRLLLASNTGQTLKHIWLEEGSIIFRSVAINPSTTISQKVTVKYYLPTEIKQEQIINHDPELNIAYDPIEGALFAAGEITLAIEETRTFLVEVEDIWNFKQGEIDTLKNQVKELAGSLKDTSYFAQATSIKSDIVVTLEKIMLRQESAITPENRIRTFRESALEMNGVEEKITTLKELVVQANGSAKPSTVTMWGIILIILIGLGFLIIYLGALRSEVRVKKMEEKPDNIYHPSPPKHRHRDTSHPGHRIARIASLALLASGLGSVGVALTLRAAGSREITLVSPAPNAKILGSDTELTFPYKTGLKLPDLGKAPVRATPSQSAPQIFSLGLDKKVYVFRIVNGWARIGLSETDSQQEWWVSVQYLEK